MTDLLSHPNPDATAITDFKPKPTCVTGNQLEAAVQFWGSADGAVTTGIWECTPGSFSTFREISTETCYILSGRVTLHSENGDSHAFGTGDMFTLPIGWRGVWEVHETVRKIYFIASVE